MLVFAAMTMNWFRVKSRWWETALLALACVLLFRPDFFMDFLAPEYKHLPASEVVDVAKKLPEGGRMVMVIKGLTIEGEERLLDVDTVIVCAGQEPARGLFNELAAAGREAHLIGGAYEAGELDAKRAIKQATELAVAI